MLQRNPYGHAIFVEPKIDAPTRDGAPRGGLGSRERSYIGGLVASWTKPNNLTSPNTECDRRLSTHCQCQPRVDNQHRCFPKIKALLKLFLQLAQFSNLAQRPWKRKDAVLMLLHEPHLSDGRLTQQI